MTAHILVVDDDPVEGRQIKNALEHFGYSITLSARALDALQCLQSDVTEIDAVLVDLTVARSDGGDFIRQISQLGLDLPIVVQTGQGGIHDVVTSIQAGAFDFVVKPVSKERLVSVVANALTLSHASRTRRSRKLRSGGTSFASIVAASQAMIRVSTLARKAAQNTIPIILEGETGVGKEMIARAIHNGSDKSTKPFVVMRCATEATKNIATLRARAEDAQGGTLFLDELADLPLDVQRLLLDLVETGQLPQPRGLPSKRMTIRIISSTTKDLIDEVRGGRFREDLYYRLNVSPIVIPALRRRIEDIPQLARMFAELFSGELRKPSCAALTSDVLALLTAYEWPGNVCQLENALYRAIALSQGGELTVDDFSHISAQISDNRRNHQTGSGPELIVSNHRRSGGAGPVEGDKMREGPLLGREMDNRQSLHQQNRHRSGAGEAPAGAISSVDENGNVRSIAEIEEELIRFALEFYRGQMSQVARKLGIGRSTLYRKLKDYGINPDDPIRDAA